MGLGKATYVLSNVNFADDDEEDRNNAACFIKVEDADYWCSDDEPDALHSPGIFSFNPIDLTDIF
jgi:hypothetical protein